MLTYYLRIRTSCAEIFRLVIFLCVIPTIISLAQESETKSISSFIDELTRAENSNRADAAYALGELGEGAKEAVPQLGVALKDPDVQVRRNAVAALGKIGEGAKGAVPQLTDALKDTDGDVRRSAATVLAQLSTILAREKATDFSDKLKAAADIMQTSSDPEVKQHADRVQQASELLKLIWWEQFKQLIVRHSLISMVIAAIPLLLMIWLTFLWLRPLWLLNLNEAISDIKLPGWLGGLNVPTRYLILAGFFHYQSRVLDAWVAKYISTADDTFSSLTTVKERVIYVPLPIIFGTETETHLSPERLRAAFSRNLICLQVWGEGGSGKTALACRLARMVMSPQEKAKLNTEHKMIPVLIEQDFVINSDDKEHPLFRAIRHQVRAMITADDFPPVGLLRQLLKKRRILVIIDGYSELNESSRKVALAGIIDLPVNAVIITSRTDEQLSGIPTIQIRPLRVEGNRLSTFMEAYLTARGKRELFDDEEFFESCRRLSFIVGDRNITALLAKLYAEQMIATKEGTTDSDAPENIPDLMLSYLNDLCRGLGPDDPDIRLIHRAAKCVAWECLKKALKPTLARREDVLAALANEEKGESLLEYMEKKLKIIQTVGASRDQIRFSLDPLAEYMAGLYLVEKNREDDDAWQSIMGQIDEEGEGTEDIRGFLLAIRDCCLAGRQDMQMLRRVADDLAQRAGIDPEENTRFRIERRVRQLINRLGYQEVEDRINASRELGDIGIPAKIAVKSLGKLLKDQERRVRLSAAVALGKIGKDAKDAVSQLDGALKDPDEEVRSSVATALGKIGDRAKATVPQLVESLKDNDARVRSSAAVALGRIGEGAKAAVPQLLESLKDSDRDVRRNVIDALVNMGEVAKTAVSQLAEVLQDPDIKVRKSVANALGMIGQAAEAAMPQLIEAVKDPASGIRDNAADIFVKIGESAAPYLVEVLKYPDNDVRLIAARALGKMGGGAVPHLRETLKYQDERVRQIAVFALTWIGVEAEAALIEASMDSDAGVSNIAIRALTKIRQEAVAHS